MKPVGAPPQGRRRGTRPRNAAEAAAGTTESLAGGRLRSRRSRARRGFGSARERSAVRGADLRAHALSHSRTLALSHSRTLALSHSRTFALRTSALPYS